MRPPPKQPPGRRRDDRVPGAALRREAASRGVRCEHLEGLAANLVIEFDFQKFEDVRLV